MANIKKLNVGDTVYVKSSGRYSKHVSPDVDPYVVVKVGRKYITVNRPGNTFRHTERQFDIETRYEKSDPNYGGNYDSMYYHEEVKRLYKIIRDWFGTSYEPNPNVSLDMLRTIKDLILPNDKK